MNSIVQRTIPVPVRANFDKLDGAERFAAISRYLHAQDDYAEQFESAIRAAAPEWVDGDIDVEMGLDDGTRITVILNSRNVIPGWGEAVVAQSADYIGRFRSSHPHGGTPPLHRPRGSADPPGRQHLADRVA